MVFRTFCILYTNLLWAAAGFFPQASKSDVHDLVVSHSHNNGCEEAACTLPQHQAKHCKVNRVYHHEHRHLNSLPRMMKSSIHGGFTICQHRAGQEESAENFLELDFLPLHGTCGRLPSGTGKIPNLRVVPAPAASQN